MATDRVVLKRADIEEYDERMLRLKHENKRLKAQLEDDGEDEHPSEAPEWEEFQTQAVANNKYVWVEVPAEVWTRLGLKGGERVKVRIALTPELNEDEKKARGTAKMEAFLVAVSENVPKA